MPVRLSPRAHLSLLTLSRCRYPTRGICFASTCSRPGSRRSRRGDGPCQSRDSDSTRPEMAIKRTNRISLGVAAISTQHSGCSERDLVCCQWRRTSWDLWSHRLWSVDRPLLSSPLFSQSLSLEGKSTTIQALFRIVEVAQGSILIDNVDIQSIPLALLRAKLAIIPQVLPLRSLSCSPSADVM